MVRQALTLILLMSLATMYTVMLYYDWQFSYFQPQAYVEFNEVFVPLLNIFQIGTALFFIVSNVRKLKQAKNFASKAVDIIPFQFKGIPLDRLVLNLFVFIILAYSYFMLGFVEVQGGMGLLTGVFLLVYALVAIVIARNKALNNYFFLEKGLVVQDGLSWKIYPFKYYSRMEVTAHSILLFEKGKSMSDVLDTGFVQEDGKLELIERLSKRLQEEGVYITDER